MELIMKRINMRKLREVFRLKFDLKLSNKKIALAVGIGETTVETYLARAKKVGVTWPLPSDMDDKQLEEALYPHEEKPLDGYALPNFGHIHKQLTIRGVTLQLLWEEYTDLHVGYSYSQFCKLYYRWKKGGETWMLQTHKAGVNTFIDYAGDTIPIYDSKTGLVAFDAQIFVSVLGASYYIFCEATRSQTGEDWIGSHKRMNEFYDGVTECWVPDNLKTGVTYSDRYEPEINRSYLDLAQHCGTSIVPARVRRPQDKSKAEGGVYFTETQILARLRDRKFFSLEELNVTLKELLLQVNHKPFQKMPGSSRYSLYLELDKPALKPLPETPFELFHWGSMTVNPSYHLTIEHVPYSVPYALVGKTVDFRYNERTVELFCKGKTIAIHPRSHERGVAVTNNQHRPPKHQYQAACTPDEIRKQAQNIGEPTTAWIERVLEDSSLHIKARINRTVGVVRLIKKYPKERLNAACARGVYYGNFTRRGLLDMLARELDKQPLPKEEPIKPLPQKHSNVRGALYYA
jgi:transposase